MLSRYAKVIGEEVISTSDFWKFLVSNHDHVLRHDPTVRAFIYRIIRRLLTSDKHLNLGLSEVRHLRNSILSSTDSIVHICSYSFIHLYIYFFYFDIFLETLWSFGYL